MATDKTYPSNRPENPTGKPKQPSREAAEREKETAGKPAANYTIDYILAAIDKAEKSLPAWLFKEIKQEAIPLSGAKARWARAAKQGLESLPPRHVQSLGTQAQQGTTPWDDFGERAPYAESSMQQYTQEYLDSLMYRIKKKLLDSNYQYVWEQIHNHAKSSAGGRASGRSKKQKRVDEYKADPATTEDFKAMPNSELTTAWLRLHQRYNKAKKSRKAVGQYVAAASVAMKEADRRGLAYSKTSPLAVAAKAYSLPAKPIEASEDLAKRAAESAAEDARIAKELLVEELEKTNAKLVDYLTQKLPRTDVMLIPDFISVVGSTVKDSDAKEPNDLDVLFRAEHDDSGKNFLVQSENVGIQVRNILDPDKSKKLHYIDGPQGSHADYVPLYDLFLRPKKEIETKVVKDQTGPERFYPEGSIIPAMLGGLVDESDIELAKSVSLGKRFAVEKPTTKMTTQNFSFNQLWPWVEEQLKAGAELIGEVKRDGYRCIITKNGDTVTVWFEDSNQDRSRALPNLVAAIKKMPQKNFILDGEMLATWKGKFVPRTQLIGILTKQEFEFNPIYYAFDCLYLDGTDLSGKPLKERLGSLNSLKNSLSPQFFKIEQPKPIKDQSSMNAVGKWASKQPGSEGMLVKDTTQPYHFGGSDSWAKLKGVVELKVLVTKVNKVKNGFTYSCALTEGNLTPYSNVVDYEGKKVVDLSKTFVTPTQMAKEGDTLNVRIEELIVMRNPAEPNLLSLAWGKPTAVGPDSAEPNTALQAVAIAKRGAILKQEIKKADVASYVGNNPLVTFVFPSPTAAEASRGTTMISSPLLKSTYLDPLNLSKDDVGITYLSPVHYTDAHNATRDPTDLEAVNWLGYTLQELASINAPVTVGIGSVTKHILGDIIDVVLPHPNDIVKKEDWKGEIVRKLRGINNKLESVRKSDHKPCETGNCAPHRVTITKMDSENHTVCGVVYEPNVIDTQGEWANADTIAKAADNYMATFRKMSEEHRKSVKSVPVRSWITDQEGYQGEGKLRTKVKKGAWMLCSRIQDSKLWEDISSGKLNAYSMGGRATKVKRSPPA